MHEPGMRSPTPRYERSRGSGLRRHVAWTRGEATRRCRVLRAGRLATSFEARRGCARAAIRSRSRVERPPRWWTSAHQRPAT
eukprot:scaffold56135_cov28-Tisochrysis_lutea.AAC.1